MQLNPKILEPWLVREFPEGVWVSTATSGRCDRLEYVAFAVDSRRILLTAKCAVKFGNLRCLQVSWLLAVFYLAPETAVEVPDLILLDIMMAGVDGLSVLRTLKHAPRTSKVPVIMLTAIAQEAVVLKGIQLGAKDYIRKPFHPTDLLDRH